MKFIEFNSSKNPTIGVEIELQLIDNITLDLKNISHKVLADIDRNFSNRIKYELFESLPLAGSPDYLDNWNHFVKLTNNLIDANVIKSVKDLWWEVRPHPGFGTVEVRICDIPINFKEILTLVALIQALVVTLQNVNKYPSVHIQILESNKWQAVRYGLEGLFIDPLTLKQITIRKAIEDLCKLVEPVMTSLGSSEFLKNIESILTKGTGSNKKRKIYNTSGSFESMIRSLKEQFYD